MEQTAFRDRPEERAMAEEIVGEVMDVLHEGNSSADDKRKKLSANLEAIRISNRMKMDPNGLGPGEAISKLHKQLGSNQEFMGEE